MIIFIDTPDNKAVGSDWVTTSKNKKVRKKSNSLREVVIYNCYCKQQEVPPTKSVNSSVGGRGSREGGGRGGSARGRGPASAGRGGSGGGRGDRERDRTGSRGPSSKPSYANGGAEQSNGSSSAVVATNGWGGQSDALFSSGEPAEAPKPAPAAPSAPLGWGGGGLTLAERLKKKAVEVRQRRPIRSSGTSLCNTIYPSDGRRRRSPRRPMLQRRRPKRRSWRPGGRGRPDSAAEEETRSAGDEAARGMRRTRTATGLSRRPLQRLLESSSPRTRPLRTRQGRRSSRPSPPRPITSWIRR